MKLVLVLLATFLHSLFNLFNVQNLIDLYALHITRQRQMLALAALNRRRRMRENGKISASQRVKTSHSHTENNQVNSAKL